MRQIRRARRRPGPVSEQQSCRTQDPKRVCHTTCTQIPHELTSRVADTSVTAALPLYGYCGPLVRVMSERVRRRSSWHMAITTRGCG